jgi:ADP-ribose pyrophosphatase YjhB (NUDIX family)
VEPGERVEEAARRELREETGLEAEVERFGTVSNPSPNNSYVSHFFIAKHVSGTICLNEESSAYTYEDVSLDRIAFHTHRVVARLHKNTKQPVTLNKDVGSLSSNEYDSPYQL